MKGFSMKLLAYLTFIFGMLLLFLLPRNRYDWVKDVDPSVPAGSFEDHSGNTFIFTVLVFLVVVTFQVVAFFRTNVVREKITYAFLVLLATCFWFFKFSS